MDFLTLRPEDFIKFIKKQIEEVEQQGTEKDYSKWLSCAVLSSEDKMRRKKLEMSFEKAAYELKVIKAKKAELEATIESLSTEWWAHLHSTYSLPHDGNYHITDGGKILVEPGSTKRERAE